MTYDELLVQWFEDIFAKNPLEVYRNENGEVQFTETGDDMIDAWEEQYVKGEDVDLWSAFSEKSKADIKARFEKFKARKTGTLIGR